LVSGFAEDATLVALRKLPTGTQAADAKILSTVADALLAANQSPPDFTGLNALATTLLNKTGSPEAAILAGIIADALTEAQQQAAAQTPTAQQMAAQAFVNAALRGVKAGAAMYLPPTTLTP